MAPTADITIPDFSRVKFPTNMTADNKKEIIEKMYAASWATVTMKKNHSEDLFQGHQDAALQRREADR
jgi:hypothetical protein